MVFLRRDEKEGTPHENRRSNVSWLVSLSLDPASSSPYCLHDRLYDVSLTALIGSSIENDRGEISSAASSIDRRFFFFFPAAGSFISLFEFCLRSIRTNDDDTTCIYLLPLATLNADRILEARSF